LETKKSENIHEKNKKIGRKKVTSSPTKRFSQIDILEKLKGRTSKITSTGIKEVESHSILEKIKADTVKSTDIVLQKERVIKEKGPKILKEIKKKSLDGFEEFIGTIRRGTQYGKTSIGMLEEIAKLKELGIITVEEFELKKKQILDRI